jgi:hypothetical protein
MVSGDMYRICTGMSTTVTIDNGYFWDALGITMGGMLQR